MADVIYNSFRSALAGDDAVTGSPVDLEGDTIQIQLHTSSYTPAATHVSKADLTGEVANGGGYTTGGQALSGCTVSYSGTTATFDATDATWASASFTARYAVLFKYNATPANAPLICCLDFGSDKTASGGDFVVEFSGTGILTVT